MKPVAINGAMRPVWALASAVQLLTRIPAPSPPEAPDVRLMGLASVFFPLVGAGLGWLGWLVASAAGRLWPPEIGAALALAVWALATGCLHEDGLADAADAFGSQRDREGLLRVMKDSRIGSYGAAALVVTYLLRWQCLARVGALGFVASQTLARAAIVWLAAWSPPAAEGAGGAAAAGTRAAHALGASLGAAAALWPLGAGHGQTLGAAAGAALAVAAAAAVYFRRRLGGVTGDCLGATAVVAECAALLALAA